MQFAHPLQLPLQLALATCCFQFLAASRTLDVDGENWIATELAHETFTDASWQDRWDIEGDPSCEIREGRLEVVTSSEASSKRSATLWWKEPLPADIMIEFVAQADLPAEDNAANLNAIIHASELDGQSYRSGRSSAYAEYKEIPNYIVTLTGGFQDGWSRLRRNPGFTLLSEDGSIRSEPGQSYRIRLMITAGRIRFWIDDRLVHDERDPQPLPGGHFALRTWHSQVSWSDIRISALTAASESVKTQR